MVQGHIKSTYYLKAQIADGGDSVEKLTSGSIEQFFTPYGKIKNFNAVIRTIAHSHAKDEELVKNQKVKIQLHAINKHVEL